MANKLRKPEVPAAQQAPATLSGRPTAKAPATSDDSNSSSSGSEDDAEESQAAPSAHRPGEATGRGMLVGLVELWAQVSALHLPMFWDFDLGISRRTSVYPAAQPRDQIGPHNMKNLFT